MPSKRDDSTNPLERSWPTPQGFSIWSMTITRLFFPILYGRWKDCISTRPNNDEVRGKNGWKHSITDGFRMARCLSRMPVQSAFWNGSIPSQKFQNGLVQVRSLSLRKGVKLEPGLHRGGKSCKQRTFPVHACSFKKPSYRYGLSCNLALSRSRFDSRESQSPTT